MSKLSFYNQKNLLDASDLLRSKVISLDKALDQQHWSDKLWLDTWEDFHHFVLETLEINDQLVGFALWTLPPHDTTAHLLKIVVDFEHRRGGYAKTLLESFASQYVDRGIYLEVQVKNQEAVHFYLSLGLKILTKTKNFYGAGQDAYKMHRAPLASSS